MGVETHVYMLEPQGKRRDRQREIDYIAKHFPIPGVGFVYSGSIDLPVSALNPTRGQYEGNAVLEAIPLVKAESGVITRALGLTSVDLYVEGLNFIFGLAEMNGGRCLVSTFMLNHEGGRYLSRLLKEVVHEMGHTFGLKHCPNRRCVMHFSNSLADTDCKSHRFCNRCLNRLQKFIEV